MRSVRDEEIIVFFEIDRHNAIKSRQNRQSRHLHERYSQPSAGEQAKDSLLPINLSSRQQTVKRNRNFGKQKRATLHAFGI